MAEKDIAPDACLTEKLDEEARKYVAKMTKHGESFEHVALMTGMARYIGNPVFHYTHIAESGRKCLWSHNEHLVTNIPFDMLMSAFNFEGISDSNYSTSEQDMAKRKVLLTHSWNETLPGIYWPTEGDIERLCLTAEIYISDKEGIKKMKGSWQRLVESIFKKGVMTDLCQPGGRMAIPCPFFDAIVQAADAENYFFFISNAHWAEEEDAEKKSEFSIVYLPSQ